MKNKIINLSIIATIYIGISILYFGIPTLFHPLSYYVNAGNDPIGFMWTIKWWQEVIFHPRNPFLTHLVWFPAGVNLAQSTSVPLIGILGAPITYFFGAALTYNLTAIFASALSAFTAFSLCKQISNSTIHSAIGGYLFGFSTYQIIQAQHIHLTLIFLIPLLVLLAYRYIHQTINKNRYIILTALLLILQFLISKEIYASFLFFSIIGLVFSYFIFKNNRQIINELGKYFLIAVVISAVLLSPYFYYFLRYPLSVFTNQPRFYSNDLLNFFIPTSSTFINTKEWRLVSAHFVGESIAYLGIPYLILLGLFIKEFWVTKLGKILTILFFTTLLISLGPFLRIAGYSIMVTPWTFISWLPLFKAALPDRFIMFSHLIAAIMATYWLTHSSKKKWFKYSLISICLLFILPSFNDQNRPWYSLLPQTQFFANGDYKKWIKPNSTVMVLPIGYHGLPTMYWQLETNMYYRMTTGYVGPLPKADNNPLILGLISNQYDLLTASVLKNYIMMHDVNYILMTQQAYQTLNSTLAKLNYKIVHVDDVYLAKIRAISALQ